MPRIIRSGRALTGQRRVDDLGDLARPCPICGAAKGWRCTTQRKWETVPRKTVHPERKGDVAR